MGDDDLRVIRAALATAVAIAAGFLTWAVFSFLTASREAWDNGTWWMIAVPFLAILSGVLGYVVPRKVWRWGAWIIAGQFAATLLVSLPHSGFGLLPLAVVFVLLPLWLLFTVPAILGAVIARRGWDSEILRG
jgi:hypothetical protein